MVTTTRPPRATPAPTSVVKEARAAARARDLVELMERRPELAGVYPPADLAVEAIRWSA
ncbi:hypothetical protein [Nocardioides sp. T2.26MG-1]|uniref:hypothetical protein n=1 Tax=Nocardioides sp. T2.26MG-1 TaxID=3041166 RepID=UPI0024774B60|nr:hypothetical protein [Nocardioides sp. T2.26MG-1]CAI9402271.1 hypothetical protein HIDPHFAB_00781 [Nocardioides sp. T2.26MG-1]